MKKIGFENSRKCENAAPARATLVSLENLNSSWKIEAELGNLRSSLRIELSAAMAAQLNAAQGPHSRNLYSENFEMSASRHVEHISYGSQQHLFYARAEIFVESEKYILH
jgi:hypothetical protein